MRPRKSKTSVNRALTLLNATWFIAACAGGDASQTAQTRSLSTAEQQKVAKMREFVRQHGFMLYKDPVHDFNEPWCGAFMDDFLTGRSMQVVEPIFVSNDPQDPRLRHYRKCEPGMPHRESLGPPSYQIDMQGIRDVGHRAYRLYRLPVRDGVVGETIEILYAELNWSEAWSNQSPGYVGVDLNRCRSTIFVPVRQSLQYSGRIRQNSNALLNTERGYFVVDLYGDDLDAEPTPKILVLSPLTDYRGRRGTVCTWERVVKPAQ